MPGEPERHLQTWAVMLVALAAPLLIAFTFLTVFGWANRPPDPVEYASDPNAGQKQSDLNNALILLHALAQFAFVGIGAWRITRRAGVRVVFLLVAIPVSAFVFLGSLLGLIAK